jgi:penicillin amidase
VPPLLKKILKLLAWVAGTLLALTLVVAAWGWWRMRGSLPVLDGNVAVSGLGAPVKIERDALGVPTITGASRPDVARALGFLHAQDRFFQMDLLRRSGAGELAELFGPAAVPFDESHRLHGFRRIAGKSIALLTPEKRAILEAYTAGVNAGLAALPHAPWEYTVLRADARPWRTEDSFLVVYAMWFDLQDGSGRFELSLQALRDSLGAGGADFFAPRGTSWDAALDGSTFPAPALPALRLKKPGEGAQASLALQDALLPGSNSLAVSGAHGAHGAIVANDMHLNLNVPHIWYRAVMNWTDAAGTAHRLAGVTLPGVPALVAGSNGAIAWGYTNSYIDTLDVVSVEVENIAKVYYKRPEGYGEIEDRQEEIRVRGEKPSPFTARWTEWGPIIGNPRPGRFLALRWSAHDPECTNLDILDLETAEDVNTAVAVAHRAGMPNQNLVVADRAGAIAWTVSGRIPRREGFDGRYPVSWAYGDRRWNGWLKPEEVPVILNPAEGLLWTANQRLVGGDAYTRLGDSGYDDGPRGGQIRDDLRALVAAGRKAVPADLLAIELDDRAVFLDRWQKFLLATLTDEAVAGNQGRAELRAAVRTWDGRASPDSAAYRIVRAWRLKVADLALAPFFEKATATYPDFTSQSFQFEDAVWRLAQEQPAALLNTGCNSWPDLLLAAADRVGADIRQAGDTPATFTWGRHTALRMRHPFSRMLPGPLARLLDMPVQPLPGAADMPRVQSASFGASERMVISPGHEDEALFHMPGGQGGNPLSPYYRAGHEAWVEGRPTPLLPGKTEHVLTLAP